MQIGIDFDGVDDRKDGVDIEHRIACYHLEDPDGILYRLKIHASVVIHRVGNTDGKRQRQDDGRGNTGEDREDDERAGAVAQFPFEHGKGVAELVFKGYCLCHSLQPPFH